MSFNIAMAACYQQGRWELALHLFTGLGKFLRPTLVSWNSALSACQAAGHWPLAILLLRRLNAESQADEISYTSTITCCSRVGRWEVGGYMLWQMEDGSKAARVPKTRFALNAAVDAFAEPKNRRQWRWPLHFLHAMGLYSLQPDEVSLSSAVRGCRAWRWALRLGPADAAAFDSLAQRMRDAGQPRFELRLLRWMQGLRIQPLTSSSLLLAAMDGTKGLEDVSRVSLQKLAQWRG